MTLEEIRQVREAVDIAEAYVSYAMPAPPDHSCGPEAGCDGECVNYARNVRDLARVRAALRILQREGEAKSGEWTAGEVSASYERLSEKLGGELPPARFIRCDRCDEVRHERAIEHDPASGINLCRPLCPTPTATKREEG